MSAPDAPANAAATHVAPAARASVLIVTHNRKDELRRAIDSALGQTVPVDVLVFDDASKDGTDAMVREVYGKDPRVSYVRAELGRGPIPARNEGMKAARTEIVFCLDDDAWFTSPETVAIVLSEFDRPEIGAVQIACWNVLENLWQAERAKDDAGCWIVEFNLEGSNAIRKDAFHRAGGYRGHVRQAEGKDLSIRLLDLGFVCRASRAPQVNHQPSSKARNMRTLFVRSAQNNLMYAWHNVPMPEFLVHVAGNVLNTLRHGLRKGWLFTSVWGVLKALAEMPRALSRRQPVRRETYRLSRVILKGDQVAFESVRGRLRAPRLSPADSASGPSARTSR